MMVFHMFLGGAVFLWPFASGWIILAGGWRWAIGFMAIAMFTDLVLMFLVLREAAYEGDVANLGPFQNVAYKSWLGVRRGYQKNINPFKVFLRIGSFASFSLVLWAGFHIAWYPEPRWRIS